MIYNVKRIYICLSDIFKLFQDFFKRNSGNHSSPHKFTHNPTFYDKMPHKEEKLLRKFLSWRQTPLTAEYNCFALQYDVICMYNNEIIRFINNACTYQKPQSARRGRLPLQCLVVIMSHTYNFLKSLSKKGRGFLKLHYLCQKWTIDRSKKRSRLHVFRLNNKQKTFNNTVRKSAFYQIFSPQDRLF